jgi:TRAP-type mannitol/chloroaromatic compound transport system permease large subunit
MPLRAKFRLLGGLGLPMGIAFAVLGAIYTGVAAVSEAAAVGVARQHLRRMGARHAHLAAPARVRAADHVHLRPAAVAELRRHGPDRRLQPVGRDCGR